MDNYKKDNNNYKSKTQSTKKKQSEFIEKIKKSEYISHKWEKVRTSEFEKTIKRSMGLI